MYTLCCYCQIFSKCLPQCKRLTQTYIVSSQLFYVCIRETNNRSIPSNRQEQDLCRRKMREKKKIRHLKMTRFIFFSIGKVLIRWQQAKRPLSISTNQITRNVPVSQLSPRPTHTQTKKLHSFIWLFAPSKNSLHGNHGEFH